MEEKTIIEIGGVKMEVDMRYATRVETYKIGDNVKVLCKKYADSYESHPGVIVGFDAFSERPTIVIAYMEISYAGAVLKFLYLNKDSKDVEICPMIGDQAIIDKQQATDMMDSAIEKKRRELDDLAQQKNYFLENFNRYFAE